MNVLITKQGRTDFELNLNKFNTIRLNRLTMYYNFYNVPNDTNVSGTQLASGYYDGKKLNDTFSPTIDEVKQTTDLNIPGISKNGFDYLDPLTFYLYVDEVDRNYNFFDGRRSTLMCTIPVTAKEWGEIITFEPRNCVKKTSGVERSMYVEIRDKHGKLYPGDFEAEFTLEN